MNIAAALSVDDLADQSGVSVRTIRYYQSEGLLPAPARHGRQAMYGAEHLDRLRLITALQDRGLRLSAISSLLDQADGAGVDEWLGLGESLVRPWSEDQPTLLRQGELDDRLARAGAPAGTAEALVRTNVVERRSDTVPVVYLVPSPGLLDVAIELARLGINLDVAARLRDLLQARLRTMATDLVTRFTEEISSDQLAASGPAALAQLLDQLQPITRRAVDLLFTHEMERAQRALLDTEVTEDTEGQSL